MNVSKTISLFIIIIFSTCLLNCKDNGIEVNTGLLPKNKKKLIELFTNTRCTICPPANEYCTAIDQHAGITEHDSSVIIIRYHTTLYANDPFYDFNPADNLARQNVYNAGTANPRGFLNGVSMGAFNMTAWTGQIDHSLKSDNEASIQITKNYTPASRTGFVLIQITNFRVTTSDSLQLFVMITQSPINYNAPNGETVFYNTLRDIITPPDGFPILLDERDENYYYEFPFSIDSVINESDVYFTAFIQNKQTLQVYGAEKIKLIDP